MSLKIKDLLDYEKELTGIIEHADKERGAIRLLINGIRLRINSGNTPDIDYGKATSVAQLIRNQIEEYGDNWFTVRQLSDKLLSMGVKKTNNQMRPLVANNLKKMFDKHLLERKNIGVKENPIYEYKKSIDNKLL